jgi:8-oxo-dGTP pyrophosphatase MutT (NUDIX family)
MADIEYATGGGVVIHNHKMLLLDRPARGEVRLPKGHIDPGETALETALRETREETGYADLEIIADLGLHEVEFEYKGRHYRRAEHYFLMRLGSEFQLTRPKADEEQFRVLWVELDQAVDYLTYSAEQDVARSAIEAFDKHKNGYSIAP